MHKIELLDGGMVFELAKHHKDFGEYAMMHDNKLVQDIHSAYLENGSAYISSSNYGFKPNRQENWKELTAISAKLMWELKEKYKFTALGCVPPYYESYHDGEITEEFKSYYIALIDILNPYVDKFIIETAVSAKHVNAIINIIEAQSDKDYLVSLYPHGNSNKEDISAIAQKKRLYALMCNCSGFKDVSSFFLEYIASTDREDIKLGFYSNKIDEQKYKDSGSGRDKIAGLGEGDFSSEDNVDTQTLTTFLDKYKNKNTLLIGGCCGYGIAEMQKLRADIKACPLAELQ